MKILIRWAGFPGKYLQRWGNFEILVSAMMLIAILSLGSGMFGKWVSSSRLDGFLSIVIQALSKADYSLDSWLPDIPFINSLSIIEDLLTGKNPWSGEIPPLVTNTPAPTSPPVETGTSIPYPSSTMTPSPTPGRDSTSTATPTLTPSGSPTPPEMTNTLPPQNTATSVPSATEPATKTPTPTEPPDHTPRVSATPTPSATSIPLTPTPSATASLPTRTPTPTHQPPTATQTPLPPTATQVPATNTPKPTNTLAPRPTHNPTFALTPTSAYTPGPTNIPPLNPASGTVITAVSPGAAPQMPGLALGELLRALLRLFN